MCVCVCVCVCTCSEHLHSCGYLAAGRARGVTRFAGEDVVRESPYDVLTIDRYIVHKNNMENCFRIQKGKINNNY